MATFWEFLWENRQLFIPSSGHTDGNLVTTRALAQLAVLYDTRDPGFESSHRHLLLNNYLLLSIGRKEENKEKEAGTCPFKIT